MNRIAELRQAKGWSRRQLAEAVDTSPQQIERLEKGQRGLDEKWMRRIAPALGVTPADLLSSEAVIQRTVPDPSVVPASLRAEPVELGKPDLPILGKAAGGRGELIIAADAEPIGWSHRPPQLRGMSGVFAVYATGSSMVPMYKPGQIIIARIDLPLSPGKGVLIEKRTDEAIIKEFVRHEDGGLVVKEYKPVEREFLVPFTEIRRVSRILAALDFA